MNGLNKAIIQGNLGRDPEIKALGEGFVANLSLATSESWNDREGNRQERTEWHRVTVFQNGPKGLVSNVIEPYVKKGSSITVIGQLRTRKWEKDGVDHYTTEIVLSGPRAELILGSRPDKGGDSEGDYRGAAQPSKPEHGDSIPF